MAKGSPIIMWVGGTLSILQSMSEEKGGGEDGEGLFRGSNLHPKIT